MSNCSLLIFTFTYDVFLVYFFPAMTGLHQWSFAPAAWSPFPSPEKSMPTSPLSVHHSYPVLLIVKCFCSFSPAVTVFVSSQRSLSILYTVKNIRWLHFFEKNVTVQRPLFREGFAKQNPEFCRQKFILYRIRAAGLYLNPRCHTFCSGTAYTDLWTVPSPEREIPLLMRWQAGRWFPALL